MIENDTAEMLVLRHLADIEGAVKFAQQDLIPKFWEAVSQTIEDWANSNNWAGGFDPEADGDPWIAPYQWHDPEDEEDDYDLYFDFVDIDGADGSDDVLGFSSFVGASAYGHRAAIELSRSIIVKNRPWKAFLGNCEEVLQELQRNGFIIDRREGRIAHLISLDANALGQAFRDKEYDEALAPLVATLAKLAQAKPLFDKLLAAARAAE